MTGVAEPRYRERLTTPWWWYLGALGVGILLGAEIGIVLPGGWVLVPFFVVTLLGAAVVYRLGSGTVQVVGQELTAGDRQLDLSRVDRLVPLSVTELRRVVGRHADPAAYTFIRSWVGPGLQLIMRDPSDTTPYWVVSTRHPDRLIAVLTAV
ncbi:DUF3093 domain-containing protein [Jatrophihabitans telluris]|uniref:DUF3093 domain-containing protein n=1 Tax=Jatrophihabitans telluris TaxID=2038343 RepID=A0ABY4QSY2_9ACTN|nr:DUF3093 domain-containing protein [Jatrophihabitans telluris]UQX86702.1 DUF3093 domain-containing protein [Jatrophihabitans telluris]